MNDEPKGADHADGDAGGSVLPEAQREEGQGISSSDLSIFHRAELENRQAAQAQEQAKIKQKKPHNPKNRPRDSPARKKQLRDLSSIDLSVLAPPQPGRKRVSIDEGFMQALYDRMMLYRYDALDALRDLAMMAISENSMQNNVKYLAASKLLGNQTNDSAIVPAGNGIRDALADLNTAYQEQSRRITEVRERVITFDDGAKIVN